MENEKMNVEQFIASRQLSENKITMLRFLDKSADTVSIEVRRKGHSIITAEFDCGAYKGSQLIAFKMSNLSPFIILASLENLTSGHIFKFEEEKAFIYTLMDKSLCSLI